MIIRKVAAEPEGWTSETASEGPAPAAAPLSTMRLTQRVLMTMASVGIERTRDADHVLVVGSINVRCMLQGTRRSRA